MTKAIERLHTEGEPAVPPAATGRGRLPVLMLAAVGIVYGDIGTSPLYTMSEAFGEIGGLLPNRTSVLGVLSLVFWSLVVIVTLKYVVIIMRADNRGEGGIILALTALALQVLRPLRRCHRFAILLAMLGAALFYGDGLITPAISVLSAVEGLKVATPLLESYVVPIPLAILVGLFLVQHRGTARVGTLFGPVMVAWFLTLAVLGLRQILAEPSVLDQPGVLHRPVRDRRLARLRHARRGVSCRNRRRSFVRRYGPSGPTPNMRSS